MLKEIDAEGKWWFAKKENIIFDGRLKFSNSGGGSLEIYGSLRPFFELSVALQGNQKNNIVLGELKNNKEKVTLLLDVGMSETSTMRENYSFARRTLGISVIFIGFHFAEENDIKFESMVIKYSNINKLIKQLHHEIDGSSRLYYLNDDYNLNAEFKKGKPIDIDIGEKGQIQIFSYPSTSILFGESIAVANEIYVKFHLNWAGRMLEFLATQAIFQDFFNLIIEQNIVIDDMIGYVKDKYKDNTSIELVHIFFQSNVTDKMTKNRTLSHLAIYDQNIVNLIQKWYFFQNEYSIVYDLYFGIMYNSELYDINKFLMIVQALEAYHDQVFGPNDLTKEEEEIWTRLKPEITRLPVSHEDKEQLEKWIENRIRPTLAIRIKNFYSTYEDILPYRSWKIENKSCFSNKVKNYRNALSHGSFDTSNTYHPDFRWVYEDLELLLLFSLCILTQLGFSNDEIKKILHIKNEIMDDKKRAAVDFFDPATETAHKWAMELESDRCDLPSYYSNEPDDLIKMVHNVQTCIDHSDDDPKQVSQLNSTQLPMKRSLALSEYNEAEKTKLMERIFTKNIKIFQDKDHKKIEIKILISISLSIWSGCLAAAQLLSKETNRGPNQNNRGIISVGIEKLCAERPVYAKGVQIAPLWKIKVGEGDDVNFYSQIIDPNIRKYEDLWRDRIPKNDTK